MSRAYGVVSITKADREARTVEGICSTIGTDRMGDRLNSRGMVARLPVPFLAGHSHSEPLGQVVWVKASDTEVRFRAQLAQVDRPPSLVERIETAFESIRAGLVRGISVGFRPLDREPLPGGGWHFKSWELLEISSVAVPANQDCSVTLVKQLDMQARYANTRVVRLTDADRAAASKHPVSDAMRAMAAKSGHAGLAELTGQGFAEIARSADATFARMEARLAKLERGRG